MSTTRTAKIEMCRIGLSTRVGSNSVRQHCKIFVERCPKGFSIRFFFISRHWGTYYFTHITAGRHPIDLYILRITVRFVAMGVHATRVKARLPCPLPFQTASTRPISPFLMLVTIEGDYSALLCMYTQILL